MTTFYEAINLDIPSTEILRKGAEEEEDSVALMEYDNGLLFLLLKTIVPTIGIRINNQQQDSIL